jgi:hypothetical protein
MNRSKALLGTSDTIHSGSASAAPIKAYLSSTVKDIESKIYPQRNTKIQSWEFQRKEELSQKLEKKCLD